MKKLSLLIVLVIVCSLGYSQKYSIQIGTNYQKMPTSESSRFFQSTFTIRNPPIDSSFIINTLEVETITQNKYLTSFGYHIGINSRLQLSNNLSFETGIHFPLSRFEIKDSSFSGSTNFISADTIFGSELPPFGSGFGSCNYTNNFSDVANSIDQSRNFTIINLMIPIKFYYELIENELSVSLGGYFATNLYSNFHTENVRIDLEEVDGENFCTYFPETIDDTSGSNLRNLNIGVTSSFEYWLGNIGAEFMFDQRLTNLFANEEDLDFQFSGNRTVPFYANMILKYRFGNSDKTNKIADPINN